MLGRSDSLTLYRIYTIGYILYNVYYTPTPLMKILSKGQSAPIIITIQLAWHNNNPMIQNMHLNHVRKSKDQEPLNFDLLPILENRPTLEIFSHKRDFCDKNMRRRHQKSHLALWNALRFSNCVVTHRYQNFVFFRFSK